MAVIEGLRTVKFAAAIGAFVVVVLSVLAALDPDRVVIVLAALAMLMGVAFVVLAAVRTLEWIARIASREG